MSDPAATLDKWEDFDDDMDEGWWITKISDIDLTVNLYIRFVDEDNLLGDSHLRDIRRKLVEFEYGGNYSDKDYI